MNWDQYFFGVLDAVTAKSQDRSRQFGAVIVDDNKRILATGYNGIPRRIAYRESYHGRPDKYMYFVHAEQNAIYNAAGTGVAIHGATMYIQQPPCADCAKGIIQSGLVSVVFRDDPELKVLDEREQTNWSLTVEAAMDMFREAQVLLRRGVSE